MDIDAVHAWWDRVEVDLKLRRGQTGARLLEVVGHVGHSPYRLRRAVEKLVGVLKRWTASEEVPKWAKRLLREARARVEVLEDVPPLGDELTEG